MRASRAGRRRSARSASRASRRSTRPVRSKASPYVAVDGNATLRGTIALFTADDRRYDVCLTDTAISDSTLSHELRYRFVQPVKITGAYVDSLDQPNPGPCEPAYPWTPQIQRSVFNAGVPPPPPSDPIDVDGSGIPAPQNCGKDHIVGTLSVGRVTGVLGFSGVIVVDVTVDLDGKIIGTRILSVKPTTTGPFLVEAAERSALASANASTFRSTTFRCQPVIDEYAFVVDFGSPP